MLIKEAKYIEKEYSFLDERNEACNIFFKMMICVLLSAVSVFANDGKIKNEKNRTIVEMFGQLHVNENQIVGAAGNPVVLRGMSLFWSQWMGQFYNYNCIKWLRDDWNCTVVRAAMGVEHGGYLENPDTELKKIKNVIDASIDLGIYVIVDWHDHNAHEHTVEAISFFKKIAAEYGDEPNVIYEIYNEPLMVAWRDTVKPYADTIIQVIRAIDPDNLIIVGTPVWSQDVDIASSDPLKYKNLVYGLHFYAATHKQFLRDKAVTALNNGAALFVSEFGTCEANGSGVIDHKELEYWFNFMEENKISWCNWSIADKNETSAALKSGADAEGNWSDNNLSESGKLVKEKINLHNKTIFRTNSD